MGLLSVPDSSSLHIVPISAGRYDKYGDGLAPSPGDLIGSGTVGLLLPLLVCAGGGTTCQFLRVVGACDAYYWGVGCLATAGGSWAKARGPRARPDGVLTAIVGGLLLGNVAGLVIGLVARGTSRWLLRR